MELREAQARVDAWIGRFEEGYWPPLANLARLTEEVGELARLLNHRFGPKTKKPEELEQDLGEELADVLFVLIVILSPPSVHPPTLLSKPRGMLRMIVKWMKSFSPLELPLGLVLPSSSPFLLPLLPPHPNAVDMQTVSIAINSIVVRLDPVETLSQNVATVAAKHDDDSASPHKKVDDLVSKIDNTSLPPQAHPNRDHFADALYPDENYSVRVFG